MDIENEKKRLRQQFRRRRAALGPEERYREQADCLVFIRRAILGYRTEQVTAGRTLGDGNRPLQIGAYLATAEELSLDALIFNELWAKQYSVCFYVPRMANETGLKPGLAFAPLPSGKAEMTAIFERSARGILEPPEISLERDWQPDILLMPCVAVDHEKKRLGQGGGCYDRYLAACVSRGWRPLTIACAYRCQLSDRPLPVDGMDRSVDRIATADGLL